MQITGNAINQYGSAVMNGERLPSGSDKQFGIHG
jgi:hypothetical protein